METLKGIVDSLSGFVWGPFLLLPLLAGTGLFLTLGLKFMPWRHVIPALRHMLQGRKADAAHEGELSPFKAMMTCMAATIGTGNIVGVATAIMLGGPGAVFWMWVTAALGMATKYSEALLAVKYREVTPNGDYVGGPMYYIKNGLGENWKWMAFVFALFGMVASFGIGNLTQCNAITGNLSKAFSLPQVGIALSLFILLAIVLIGGVKRIGDVAGLIVPFMSIAYVIMAIFIMIINYDKVGPAFFSIFKFAFAPAPAAGGVVGGSIVLAMRYGAARGIFSNEAGLGSGPIAHATAITDSPVRQGFLGMIDPFLDTIVVCTMTAIIILIAGDWATAKPGTEAVMTSLAFEHALPGFGQYAVALCLALFAFTTVLGWCVYGERCAVYLFGHNAIKPFRILFCIVAPIGSLMELGLVWSIADLFNALMALPNLVALLLLSPVVFKMTREYFDSVKAGKILE